MSGDQNYPHIQYSAELHTHQYPQWPNRQEETHSHRTWLEFHGHDGLPVDPNVQVTVIYPNEAAKEEAPIHLLYELSGRAQQQAFIGKLKLDEAAGTMIRYQSGSITRMNGRDHR